MIETAEELYLLRKKLCIPKHDIDWENLKIFTENLMFRIKNKGLNSIILNEVQLIDEIVD
jgi:hypothetical protein